MQNATISYLEVYQQLASKNHFIDKINQLVENEDINALDELYLWLRDIEDTFRRNRFSEFMEIASCRSSLLMAQFAFDRKIPRKKGQLETVSNLLPIATKTINNVMKPIEERIEESRIIMKDLIAKAYDSNMVQWNDGLNFPDFVHALWRLFLKHEHFKESAKCILEKVSEADALQILAKEINAGRTSRS